MCLTGLGRSGHSSTSFSTVPSSPPLLWPECCPTGWTACSAHWLFVRSAVCMKTSVAHFASGCLTQMLSNSRVTLGPSETLRRRGYIFNLTTEPVSWLLLPLWQFICSVKQFLDVTIAIEKWAVRQQKGPQCSTQASLHELWTGTFVTCHACEGNLIPGSTQSTMEQQAWIMRSILTQLESQEAAGEEAPNGIAGEFAVSHLWLL